MGDTQIPATAHTGYDRRMWVEAYDQLSSAPSDELSAPDLQRLALAAYMTGHQDASAAALERLHHVLLDARDVAGACRWAIWLAITLFQSGHHAQGGGWIARAERLLTEADLDCPERGYLLLPAALQAMGGGDGQTARELFEQVTEIARRFADPDLIVLATLGTGQALVALGDARRGVVLLDEAMVAATTDDVLPLVTGIVYCAVIIACRDVFDVRRAQEWTAALSRWCSDQQGLRPYRGQCLVHRSEIMVLRGEWPEALEEVEHACAHLADPPGDPVLGMARYQQAELLRLRGAFTESEAGYRQAGECGHPVQPGLALLRLAQGRTADAATAIRRELEQAGSDRVRRARVLAASVEILLVAGQREAAAGGVEELEASGAEFDSAYLQAVAAGCRGALLLAGGQAAQAVPILRRSWAAWQSLDAPYEAACVRALLAQGCRALGDREGAEMQIDAARRVFEHLGAAPALARLVAATRPEEAGPGCGLTAREVEVLRLVATGVTNRSIADRLVISEKTVARHLSNMFTKLGVTSRAAATAWAYEHDLT